MTWTPRLHTHVFSLGKGDGLKGKETVLTLSKRTKEHFSRPLISTKPKRKVPQFLALAATKSFHLQTWSEAFILFEWRQKAFFAQKDFICISTSFYLWAILTFISNMKYLFFFVFSHPKPLIVVKKVSALWRTELLVKIWWCMAFRHESKWFGTKKKVGSGQSSRGICIWVLPCGYGM